MKLGDAVLPVARSDTSRTPPMSRISGRMLRSVASGSCADIRASSLPSAPTAPPPPPPRPRAGPHAFLGGQSEAPDRQLAVSPASLDGALVFPRVVRHDE